MGGKNSSASVYRYQTKAYDRINLQIGKGDKQRLQDHAAARGQSLNAWVREAINRQLTAEGGDTIKQLDSAPGAAAGDGDTTN